MAFRDSTGGVEMTPLPGSGRVGFRGRRAGKRDPALPSLDTIGITVGYLMGIYERETSME
jgi:hypothetical protein